MNHPDYVHHREPFNFYSQGPQGDPFAPQLLPSHLLVQPQEDSIPTPKPNKKRRRVRVEEECSFCQGDNENNKAGKPEAMVTCSECGRSGHPSCMELEGLGDVMRQYAWRCMECKICEICQEKGDDERILFCDHCDRGWHMYCLKPPIESPPTGKWHCPMCPPLELFYGPPPLSESIRHPENQATPGMEYSLDAHMELDPELQVISHRQPSVDSSSHSTRGGTKRKASTKRVSDDAEGDVGESSRPPPPTRKKTYRKVRRRIEEDENDQTPLQHRKTRRPTSPVPIVPSIRIKLPLKGKGKAKEEEEQQSIFNDILSMEERDVSKTLMQEDDKRRFERSRQIAEEKLTLARTNQSATSESPDAATGSSSRSLRAVNVQSAVAHGSPSIQLSESPAPFSPAGNPSYHTLLASSQPTLRISNIRFGEFDIKTWYDAPFPEEYAAIPDGRLWICEFCLKYMKSRFGAVRHKTKCKARHPPGDEIYRDGVISVFEVDGRKNKIYCQNLCLLSKMFLDHKSLFYDVEPFLFYVMTELDEMGYHFVGYFSKEKWSSKDYNLSCIMTLPVRQRQGWGNLLMDFSYLLSKKEQRLGSPEKPLSGLGAIGYSKYWTLATMRFLSTAPDNPRLEDICEVTSMTMEDVYNTLQRQNMIDLRHVAPSPARPPPGQTIKFPRGRKNGATRRAMHREKTIEKLEQSNGPFVPPTQYYIHWDHDAVTKYLGAWESKGYLVLKPEKLKWSPFISARTRKTTAIEATNTTQLLTTEKLERRMENGVSNTDITTPNSLSEVALDVSPKDIQTVTSQDDSLLPVTSSVMLESKRTRTFVETPSPSRRSLRKQTNRSPTKTSTRSYSKKLANSKDIVLEEHKPPSTSKAPGTPQLTFSGLPGSDTPDETPVKEESRNLRSARSNSRDSGGVKRPGRKKQESASRMRNKDDLSPTVEEAASDTLPVFGTVNHDASTHGGELDNMTDVSVSDRRTNGAFHYETIKALDVKFELLAPTKTQSVYDPSPMINFQEKNVMGPLECQNGGKTTYTLGETLKSAKPAETDGMMELMEGDDEDAEGEPDEEFLNASTGLL